MTKINMKLVALAFGVAGVFAPLNSALADAPLWKVNAAQSGIYWSTSWTNQPVTGNFNNFSANIKFNPDDLKSSSVVVNIPLNPIASPSREAMDNLPLKDWLDTKAFPNAKYESNSFRKTGANSYVADGFLTLKGVKYKLALPFTLQTNGNQAVMTGKVVIDRMKLKIGLASDGKGEWVSRNVTVNIKVTATK